MVTGPAEGNVNWWGSMWWDTTAKLSTWALVINVLISRCKRQEEEWGGGYFALVSYYPAWAMLKGLYW